MDLFWLAPPSAEGPAWPAPLSHPLHPPTFLGTGGHPLYPRRGLRPLHPAGGEMRGAPSFHLAHRPTLLGTGGLTILPRKQRPLRPAWGRRGGQGRFLAFPRVRGQGQRRPRGAWERGMGPLRSAIQRGDSPVKRGHGAVIAQSSAVIAPTAVRPRCDGLFPAGAALRRFSEQGDTLHLRRGLRALHVAWGRDGGVVISRWRVGSPCLACP